MDSTESSPELDQTVHLRTTLEEGAPLPLFIIADLQSRDGDDDLVISTSHANVRLTTTTVNSSVSGSATVGSTEVDLSNTIQPGLCYETRLEIFDFMISQLK